jgi:hypothetical protein
MFHKVKVLTITSDCRRATDGINKQKKIFLIFFHPSGRVSLEVGRADNPVGVPGLDGAGRGAPRHVGPVHAGRALRRLCGPVHALYTARCDRHTHSSLSHLSHGAGIFYSFEKHVFSACFVRKQCFGSGSSLIDECGSRSKSVLKSLQFFFFRYIPMCCNFFLNILGCNLKF